MSDEEVVDSDVGAPLEDSADSPTEGVEDDTETAKDETSNETPSPEQKRLADTEAALKERQREFHQVSRELAELRGQLSAVKQMQQPAATQKDVLDDEKLASELRDDPSKVLEILKRERSSLQQQVASVLEARDNYWRGELMKVDPEVVAMRNQIAKLREDPDFADFSDAQLAKLAKKNVTNSPKKEYRGAPGGRRQTEERGQKDITEDPMFKMIYAENPLLNQKKK